MDEELLALAGPPPSLRHGIFTLIVIILSVVMLTWFYQDLAYLLQGLGAPEHLGDAADIDVSKLKDNSYVSVDGIPWITKSIRFHDWFKWFAMSDTTRKLFPLTGQPKLFVQWTIPQKDKAYRDPNVNPSSPMQPGYFEGHLVRRNKAGKSYNRVWAFIENKVNLEVADDAWLLIDGEMPGDKVWIVLVYLLLSVMIVVNSVKLYRIWTIWRS